MKKTMAFAVAVVLLLSLAACGEPAEDGAQNSTTTTTTTTAAGDTTTSAATTGGTDSGDTTVSTVTTATTTAATTNTYAPSGATVPIGTKPTTTTTTKKPTTTQQAEEPGADTTAAVTTTTTATKPTTTTTVTKPTEPAGPYIVLPEIGSDIDVTKNKNRIRVSAVAAWYNDNGSIGVSLTFKNYSSNWITEETDYVEYTCYDKNGNVVQKATKIMIGVIDTKKNSVKEFTFAVPAATAEVRITKSKMVYWTEWS